VSETNWIDWHPKVGDSRPDVFRWKHKELSKWQVGDGCGIPLRQSAIDNNDYQIPAPEPKENETMKYWQPRREPMAKGWTLADVPDGVVCEIVKPVGTTYFASKNGDKVFDHTTDVSLHIKPSECRVIRVIDPIPPGAMTLDKVPEGVRCVVDFDGTQRVCKKIREAICGSDGVIYVPQRGAVISVLHILDPLPELSVTLDTLPVGRVIEQDKWKWFKDHEGDLLSWHGSKHGLIVFEGKELTLDELRPWQVTDIIMELKETT
jgi:hypothetical protein